MQVEFRTMKIRARGRVVGSEVDVAVLDAELQRAGSDGWQLASGFGTRMDKGTGRYFVIVLCRHRRR